MILRIVLVYLGQFQTADDGIVDDLQPNDLLIVGQGNVVAGIGENVAFGSGQLHDHIRYL